MGSHRLWVVAALVLLAETGIVSGQIKSAFVDAAVNDLQSDSREMRERGEVRLYAAPPTRMTHLGHWA